MVTRLTETLYLSLTFTDFQIIKLQNKNSAALRVTQGNTLANAVHIIKHHFFLFCRGGEANFKSYVNCFGLIR